MPGVDETRKRTLGDAVNDALYNKYKERRDSVLQMKDIIKGKTEIEFQRDYEFRFHFGRAMCAFKGVYDGKNEVILKGLSLLYPQERIIDIGKVFGELYPTIEKLNWEREPEINFCSPTAGNPNGSLSLWGCLQPPIFGKKKESGLSSSVRFHIDNGGIRLVPYHYLKVTLEELNELGDKFQKALKGYF